MSAPARACWPKLMSPARTPDQAAIVRLFFLLGVLNFKPRRRALAPSALERTATDPAAQPPAALLPPCPGSSSPLGSESSSINLPGSAKPSPHLLYFFSRPLLVSGTGEHKKRNEPQPLSGCGFVVKRTRLRLHLAFPTHQLCDSGQIMVSESRFPYQHEENKTKSRCTVKVL